MPRSGNTWQDRGAYLAGCVGLTATAFAAGIDKAMAAARQAAAANPVAGERTATRKKTQRKPAGARTKEPAAAGT